jgi:hypothetical protein
MPSRPRAIVGACPQAPWDAGIRASPLNRLRHRRPDGRIGPPRGPRADGLRLGSGPAPPQEPAGAGAAGSGSTTGTRLERTASATVAGTASASPRSWLKRIETVFDTPRSSIVTP